MAVDAMAPQELGTPRSHSAESLNTYIIVPLNHRQHAICQASASDETDVMLSFVLVLVCFIENAYIDYKEFVCWVLLEVCYEFVSYVLLEISANALLAHAFISHVLLF